MPESDGATLGQMSATIVECHQRGSPKAVICCAQPIPLIEKAAAGLTAGGLGAHGGLAGGPVTLIRMQADNDAARGRIAPQLQERRRCHGQRAQTLAQCFALQHGPVIAPFARICV